MSEFFTCAQPFSYTDEIAICDDIKTFIEKELLKATNKDEIRAYQKILKHIKGVRKATDEGMY